MLVRDVIRYLDSKRPESAKTGYRSATDSPYIWTLLPILFWLSVSCVLFSPHTLLSEEQTIYSCNGVYSSLPCEGESKIVKLPKLSFVEKTQNKASDDLQNDIATIDSAEVTQDTKSLINCSSGGSRLRRDIGISDFRIKKTLFDSKQSLLLLISVVNKGSSPYPNSLDVYIEFPGQDTVKRRIGSPIHTNIDSTISHTFSLEPSEPHTGRVRVVLNDTHNNGCLERWFSSQTSQVLDRRTKSALTTSTIQEKISTADNIRKNLYELNQECRSLRTKHRMSDKRNDEMFRDTMSLNSKITRVCNRVGLLGSGGIKSEVKRKCREIRDCAMSIGS